MVVELDADVFVVAGYDGSKTEFSVLDLRALSESWFVGHMSVVNCL
jgi:hypothetical protein